MIGTSVGSYVLTARLGEGAFAHVYLAESQSGGPRYAIKVLRAEFASDPILTDRFRNEAKCGALLRECPHIVQVHRQVKVGELPALVMDLIDGPDLEQVIAATDGRGLGVPAALRFAHDVAFALQYAHRHGISHRDVKPSNCLIDAGSQRALLSDFGIALREGAKRVTKVAIGTRPYMAPEVIRLGPGQSGPASDVYAVGVMLYEMLTGVLPFDGHDELELLGRVLSEPPMPPSHRCPAVPPRLDDLVVICLAKLPEARFADGAALFDALLELRTQTAAAGDDAGYQISWPAVPRPTAGGARGPTASAVLIDISDPSRPVAHAIPAGGLTMGFDSSNRVKIDHPRVSGRHAVIIPAEGGGFLLTDTSTNGTWVGGRCVRNQTVPIDDGDLLALGRSHGSPRFLLVRA